MQFSKNSNFRCLPNNDSLCKGVYEDMILYVRVCMKTNGEVMGMTIMHVPRLFAAAWLRPRMMSGESVCERVHGLAHLTGD